MITGIVCNLVLYQVTMGLSLTKDESAAAEAEEVTGKGVLDSFGVGHHRWMRWRWSCCCP